MPPGTDALAGVLARVSVVCESIADTCSAWERIDMANARERRKHARRLATLKDDVAQSIEHFKAALKDRDVSSHPALGFLVPSAFLGLLRSLQDVLDEAVRSLEEPVRADDFRRTHDLFLQITTLATQIQHIGQTVVDHIEGGGGSPLSSLPTAFAGPLTQIRTAISRTTQKICDDFATRDNKVSQVDKQYEQRHGLLSDMSPSIDDLTTLLSRTMKESAALGHDKVLADGIKSLLSRLGFASSLIDQFLNAVDALHKIAMLHQSDLDQAQHLISQEIQKALSNNAQLASLVKRNEMAAMVAVARERDLTSALPEWSDLDDITQHILARAFSLLDAAADPGFATVTLQDLIGGLAAIASESTLKRRAESLVIRGVLCKLTPKPDAARQQKQGFYTLHAKAEIKYRLAAGGATHS